MNKIHCIAAASSLLCGCSSPSKTVVPETRSPSLILGTPNVELTPREEKALRPRTIKEALTRENQTYDAAMLAGIQSRWYKLLDQVSRNKYRHGKVVVQFRLNYDGRITDLKIAESTVGEILALLCQKAILDPAPYDKWPETMRRAVGEGFRDLTMTFYYN